MLTQASRTYLQHRVMTASSEQLQSMLYDGAIRFARACRDEIVRGDFEKAQTAFEKCDAILVELHSGLRPERNSELTERFASLYNFCQRRLDEGNFKHDTLAIEDALTILSHLRDTWSLVVSKIEAERPVTQVNSTQDQEELASFAVEL